MVVCRVCASLQRSRTKEKSSSQSPEPDGSNTGIGPAHATTHQQAVGVPSILKKPQPSACELPCKLD